MKNNQKGLSLLPGSPIALAGYEENIKPEEHWFDGEPATDVDVQAMYWFKRVYGTGDIADEEYRAFEKWFTERDTHRAVFRELLVHWGDPDLELTLKEKFGSRNQRPPAELEEEALTWWDEQPATEIEIQAVHWFKIMSDVEVSREDRKAFRRWLVENDDHQAVYSELQALWDDPYFDRALEERYQKRSGFIFL